MRFVRAVGVSLLLGSSVVACDGVLGIVAIDGGDGIEVSALPDASSEGGLATAPPDAGADTSTGDATLGGDDDDASDAGDATAQPDAPDADAGTAGDACAALVARMLSAPIVAPSRWAGLDLTNGGLSDDVPGSGGLSLVQNGVLACATGHEPTTTPAGASPAYPGYRGAWYGTAGPGGTYPLSIYSNLQSGAIHQIVLADGYTGTLSFHSRAGGAYGSHTYEVSIGAAGPQAGGNGAAPVDAGAGGVKRDGADFAADWSIAPTDAGTYVASAWINELYDGIMATFSPSAPAIGDCFSTPLVDYNRLGQSVHETASCIVVPQSDSAYFGVRPLSLYFTFNVGTNQTNGMYAYWLGGGTTCSTLTANLERMDYAPISAFDIGNLESMLYGSNPNGMTFTEGNAFECNGTVVSPEDDAGVGAMAWGPSGEVVMEYDATGLNTKISAKAGYKGLLQFSDATGTNAYSTGVDVPLTSNGQPVQIQWPAPGPASSTASLTALSNAVCGLADDDCVLEGDCNVTANDGRGHSVIEFTCGFATAEVALVFPLGSTTPVEIYAVNPDAN
jgi:hypothetical protein